jgi:nitroreductase
MRSSSSPKPSDPNARATRRPPVTAGVSLSGVSSTAMATSKTKPAEADVVLRALRRTHQVRDLRPEPVPDDVQQQLLEVARWTGSSTNWQPWTFIVIRDRDRLEDLARLLPNASHVGRASFVIAIAMPGEKPEWESYDEGRVAERLLVAAEALGLGAAMGWAFGPRRAPVSEFLGVKPPGYIRTLVSVGHASAAARAPKSAPGSARKPLADLVRYERFD